MRLHTAPISLLLVLIAVSSAFGQRANGVTPKRQETAQLSQATETADTGTKAIPAPATRQDVQILVYLVGGGQIRVDELTERADGYWYKRGNVTTLLDKTRVEKIERPEDIQARAVLESPEANWSISDASRVETFFVAKFNRRLPLTAFGQSELHTRWGLDHRRGMDVGLHPDSAEGKVLITFLRTEKIPFLAFRSAIPGVATGPHIHIGKGSHRLPADK